MKVTEFNQGTMYNGILPVRPDMSEDKVLIRKYRTYSILFFVLSVVFLITTIVIAIIFGINIKEMQRMESSLESCVETRDSLLLHLSLTPAPSIVVPPASSSIFLTKLSPT